MPSIAAFLSGLLFALGLGIAGMTRPSKVIGFLDVGGVWDPSLLFVMFGGIAIYASFYVLVRRRQKPLFEEQFHVPDRNDIDKRLLCGAAIFGLGWGIAGYCPGPGLVSLASGAPTTMGFVLSMGFGMILRELLDRRTDRSKDSLVKEMQ